MLDVHIAVSAHTPLEWQEQCLASVIHAATMAMQLTGMPVSIFEVDGVPGHIGEARAIGFSRGEAPFVTYVDDDDFVEPSAFACLLPALALNPRLVFTREKLLQNGKFAGFAESHHLAVMRRDDVLAHPWGDYPSGGERVLYATLGEPLQLSAAVYTHRLYRSKGRELRNLHG